MNNALPASCCLISAQALPPACRAALAGAVPVLPEQFLFFPQADRGTWLGRLGQQIVYLQLVGDAPLQLHCLHQQDILCLCCTKKLLIEDCCIYYRTGGAVQSLTLPLSQMRRELVTLLLALLQPQGQMTATVAPMPVAAGEFQELCSYAPAATAFGQHTGSWNLWRIEEKGFPFRKKGRGSAALYYKLERGSIVVARRNTQIVTWYLPSDRCCLLSCLEHGTMTLRIHTGQQVLGEVPGLKAESMVSA